MLYVEKLGYLQLETLFSSVVGIIWRENKRSQSINFGQKEDWDYGQEHCGHVLSKMLITTYVSAWVVTVADFMQLRLNFQAYHGFMTAYLPTHFLFWCQKAVPVPGTTGGHVCKPLCLNCRQLGIGAMLNRHLIVIIKIMRVC